MMNVEKKSALLEFVKSIVISFIFVTILTQWVIKPIQVNQSSMYPTLKDQQLGFSNILSYQVFGIKYQFSVRKKFPDFVGDKSSPFPPASYVFRLKVV